MIKFCPDLTGKEEVKAILAGSGDFTRPVLNACIKNKCVAYRDGKCNKYGNEVESEPMDGDGWIPVEERLPEEVEQVLVTIYGRYGYDSDDAEETYEVRLGWINTRGYWQYINEGNYKDATHSIIGNNPDVFYMIVTAWKPLPEHYKGGTDEY